MATSNLDVELVRNFLEALPVLGKFWKMDVNRSSQSSTKVCRAGGDVTEVVVVRELCAVLDLGGCAAKTVKDLTNISSLLHRNDAELIFFVDPDEESLLCIVEDSPTLGPIAIQATSLKEAVSLLEQEVVRDQLALNILRHAIERVEGASKVAIKAIARLNDGLHDLVTIFVRNARA